MVTLEVAGAAEAVAVVRDGRPPALDGRREHAPRHRDQPLAFRARKPPGPAARADGRVEEDLVDVDVAEADGFTAEALFGLTRRRRTSVKALLMDQRRIAGLGNIYVNEILFHAAGA